MSNSFSATVLRVSRRFIRIYGEDGKIYDAHASSKALDLVVGDRVKAKLRSNEVIVDGAEERKNFLRRTLGSEERGVVANLDRLVIVSALPNLVQAPFIDRMLVLSRSEGIETSLVINKMDLDRQEAEASISRYQDLGLHILFTSAKFGEGMTELSQWLFAEVPHSVAFLGLSGVGKSTILNRLVPEAERSTAEVSKSGQGRQTTTQAEGYLVPRPSGGLPLLMVDLPGFQRVGLPVLPWRVVADAFEEFTALRQNCKFFGDCRHLEEENCAVKKGLESGTVFPERYLSYCNILEEIEKAKPY